MILRNLKNKRYSAKTALLESGSIIVAYIMLLPVLVGAFGVAMDSTIAVYTRTTIQSNLDSAVQSTISAASNPTNGSNNSQPTLRLDQAKNLTTNYYSSNRTEQAPFLHCQNAASMSQLRAKGNTPNTPYVLSPTACPWVETDTRLTVDADGTINFTTTVIESSNTTFLNILGIDSFTYVVTSDASLGYVYRDL